MNVRPRTLALAVALSCCTLVAFLSCSDPSSISTVNVTLREFSVRVDQATVPDGKVTFHVSNAGTVNHEFLVIRTDLAADALPTDTDGAYAENGARTTLIDEIEDIAPGQSKDVTIDLDKAKYVLICNMVHRDGATVSAHYALGMRTSFEVD